MRRDGYVPDIDLGVVGDGTSEARRRRPTMDPVVIYPEDDHGVQVSADPRAARAGVPGVRLPLRHARTARSCSRATPVRATNVVRLARGADVLVHEVIDVDRLAERIMRLPNDEQCRNHLASSHSSPEQVGDDRDQGAGVRHARALAPRARRLRGARGRVGGAGARDTSTARCVVRRRPRRVRPRSLTRSLTAQGR